MDRRKRIIEEKKLVSFFRFDSQELTMKTVEAVLKGGISILEITLTTPGAFEILQELRKNENIILGAGTVLNMEDAQKVADIGVDLIISPHTDENIIKFCSDARIVVFPGAGTPTEIYRAWSLGADYVKIFPAYTLGGPAFIKAVLGPFPFLKMYPTNGITADNFNEYLDAGAKAVGLAFGGADPKFVHEGNFEAVTECVKKVVETVS